MANRFSKLAAAVSLACVLPLASADVLTFEDTVGTNFFLSTYHGFNFGDNSIATNPWFYTDAASPFYVPHSGTHYVSTDFQLYDNTIPSQRTQAITSATAFTFQGAWFTGGDQIRYDLMSGSTVVYSSALSTELTATPSFVSSGYAGLITGVVIFGRQGYYAMDDFTYNTPAVPEPETYAMMAAGLMGVGFMARRRQQRRG